MHILVFFEKYVCVCVCVIMGVYFVCWEIHKYNIYIYIDTIIGKLDYLNNRSVAIYH